MQRKTVGILLLAVPLPLLVITLAVYAIASFVIASLVMASDGDGSGAVVIGQILSIVLGLIGVAAVIGLIIGIPLGIYLIVTADKHTAAPTAPLPPVAPPQV